MRWYDDVTKWKHFQRNWPFVRGIHRSPVNSPHIGQWRGALMFSLICVWINCWVNTCEAGDLRRYRAHYDGTIMSKINSDGHKLRRHHQTNVLYEKTYHSLNILKLMTVLDIAGGHVMSRPLPRRNRRHFADDIFKYMFLNENVLVSIEISLNFIPKGLINNIPALI